MKETKSPFPCTTHDLVVTGTVVDFQQETREYEKDGQKKTLVTLSAVLKTSFGICLFRSFNPNVDLASLVSEGDNVSFPVRSFETKEGFKFFTIRT